MAPSSQSKTSRSPYRFYDYLKCLQEEFDNRFTDDMSPRRFNIYLGNLKGEFELMLLEIESLQKERDEYRNESRRRLKNGRTFTPTSSASNATKGRRALQIAIPSRPKRMKTGPRLFFQSRTLDKPRSSDFSINMAQETTTHRSSQHATLIQKLSRPLDLSLVSAITKNTETPTLPRSSNSTSDRPKERGQMVEFNNEVERELDVGIAHTLFHAEPLGRVKFSRDGKYLAAGSVDVKTYIYDVQEGTLTCVLQNLLAKDDCIRAVCFSPDGKYLATGAWDGTLYIWEINRKYVRNAFKGHTSHIMSLDFSPNGRLLLSASGDNTVRLWNMHDGTAKLLIEENITFLDRPLDCYPSAVFSPDGRYVAASHSDGVVGLWDVCTGQLTRKIKAHTRWASCVFTPDGKGLMSAGWDYTLRYWDVSFLDFNRLRERSRVLKNSHRETLGITWGPDREFLGNERFLHSLAISPDGRWIASHSKSVRIRDTRNATIQCTLSHDDSIFASFVDFSPTGRYLASGGNDGILKIWRYSNIALHR